MGVQNAAERGVGPEGWSEPGDWYDSIDFEATVRFHVDTFGGKVVIHCHKLKHEDEGLMGVVNIVGGCDAFYGDIDEYPALGCEFETCADNASFSDYDWANESVGFEPRACPDSDTATDPALIVGLSVLSVLLCCGLITAAVYLYFVKGKQEKKSARDLPTVSPMGDAGQSLQLTEREDETTNISQM